MATIDRKEFEDEDHLWTAFKYFDVDNTGFITADNLVDAFMKAGKDISEEEIQSILEEVDIDGTGNIDF